MAPDKVKSVGPVGESGGEKELFLCKKTKCNKL